MGATVNPRIAHPKGNTPVILLQCGVPIGIAPTGTMAANGAVTLGTALNTTYSAGIWLYFASGAVYAGSSAGFFWTVMSSTTVGTVYDTTYTPGSTSFDIPASPTAIVAAGPGAFTGVTSEITAISVILPGGSLGKHGSLAHRYRDARANTAGAKTIKTKLDATITVLNNTATSLASVSFVNSLQNIGVENRQSMVAGVSDSSGGASTAVTMTSIDTSVDRTVTYTFQLAAATDYMIMQGCSLIVYPG